ncbi:hypothetical protein GCM10009678_04900 [Actinomadura kijaniata]|uniref:Uncharacterized protein n=1 Tax=Actinomadura namibiensis TaxID=182080 RepID=A0A7W3LTB9_ACTNM|nr:hypothetical protein [Actinomadura namibiensis]MBA8953946.1 hypothetical protein [Actinomadura namibiensis]
MALFAVLTGGLFILIWSRQINNFLAFVLISWGLLAASTPIGEPLVKILRGLSSQLDGWLS